MDEPVKTNVENQNSESVKPIEEKKSDDSKKSDLPSKKSSEITKPPKKLEEKKPIPSEVKPAEVEKRRLSLQKSSESTPKIIIPVKPANVVKKPAPVSQRQSTTSVDLLDTILDDQSAMLTQKYKTEDERSEERQKIEMEKRMKSQGSYILPPMEKRTPVPARRDSVSGPLKVTTPDTPQSGPRSDPIKQPSRLSLSSTNSLPHDSGRGISIEQRLHQIFSDVSPVPPTPEFSSPQSQSSSGSTKLVPPPPPGPRPLAVRPIRQGPPPPPGPRPLTARPLAAPPPPPGPRPTTARPLRPPAPPGPPPPTAKRIEPVPQVTPPHSGPSPTHVRGNPDFPSSIPQISPGVSELSVSAATSTESASRPRTKFDQPPPALPVNVQLPPPGLRQLPKTRFDQPPPGVSMVPPIPPPQIIPLPVTRVSSLSESIEPEFKSEDAPIQTLPPPQLLTDLPKKILPPQPALITPPIMSFPYNVPMFDPTVPPPLIPMMPPTYIPPPPVSLPKEKEPEVPEVNFMNEVNPYESVAQEEQPEPMEISDDGEGGESDAHNSYLIPLETSAEDGGYDPLEASKIVRTRETLLEEEKKVSVDEDSESSASEDETDDSSDTSSETESDDNDSNRKAKEISVKDSEKKDETASLQIAKESDAQAAEKVSIDALKKNPALLLQKASDVLKILEGSKPQILQEELIGEYEVIEEEKPPPDFHGEPVPEDEEDDDALFELAAGMPRKKKEPKPIVEEPWPDERFIELDYCELFNFD